jgi:hypothetical protein
VLHELLFGAQAVLGDRLIGLYLYGSLASGDFDPQRSDIDFVVVTRGEVPQELVPALEELHKGLWEGGSQPGGSKWATKLEGAYISQAALRRYNPNDPPRPAVNEGRFYLDSQDSAWIIQRHILREHGVAVAGPPLRGMIDPVSVEALKRSVTGILLEWWAPMLENPVRLQTAEYQLRLRLFKTAGRGSILIPDLTGIQGESSSVRPVSLFLLRISFVYTLCFSCFRLCCTASTFCTGK